MKAKRKGEKTVVMAKGVKEFRDDCIEIGRKEGIEQGRAEERSRSEAEIRQLKMELEAALRRLQSMQK